MKCPQRTLIASFSHQLVTVVTLLSFGMNAFGADVWSTVPVPTGNPKTDLGNTVPYHNQSSWPDSATVKLGQPAPPPATAGDGNLNGSNAKTVKSETVAKQVGGPDLSNLLADGQRAKEPEQQKATPPEGVKPLCFGLKGKEDDEKLVKAWEKELDRISVAHKSVRTADLQRDRKNFLDTAIRVVTNYSITDRAHEKMGICEYRRKLEQNVHTVSENIKKETPGEEVCKRTEELYDIQQQRLVDVESYRNELLTAIKGGERKVTMADGSVQKASFRGLKQAFDEGQRNNQQKVNGVFPPGTKVENLDPTQFKLAKSLTSEYVAAWGNGNSQSAKSGAKVAEPGMFLNISKKFQAEYDQAINLRKQLEEAQKQLEKKDPTCYAQAKSRGSVLGGRRKPGDPSVPSPRPIAGRDQKPESTVSASIIPPSNESDEDALARLKVECEAKTTVHAKNECLTEMSRVRARFDADTRQVADLERKLNPSAPPSGPNTAPPPADQEQPLRKPTFTNTDSASSFLSENAGLLVGGGLLAAGGAGLYFWNKSENDKRQEEWESYWANVQASTAGSSSTSTATTARTLLVKSGVGNAAVSGVNLPPIQVAIVDGAGITLTGQDIDITMSCTTPIPCYMTGTTTVRSVNGVATFSDIRFTQGVNGVRIRFAAPWGGVDQANSFDVQPLAGSTNTSTGTLTGTLTSTDTSTNTNTVTNTTTNTSTSTSTDTRM